MNVYEKINKAKIELANLNLKMGGKNVFAKYNYYELEDFLPQLNKICQEIGLSNIVSFNSDYAFLLIVDTEKPEDTVEVRSPMSQADMKGCQPVQNLGAVETYIKRYLYQLAYDIVEYDALSVVQGGNNLTKDEVVNKLKNAKVDEEWRKLVLSQIGSYDEKTLEKLVNAIPNKEKEFQKAELDRVAGDAFK
jgi:hypothetical protein